MQSAHAMSPVTLLAVCIAFYCVDEGLESDMRVSMACFPKSRDRLRRQKEVSAKDLYWSAAER